MNRNQLRGILSPLAVALTLAISACGGYTAGMPGTDLDGNLRVDVPGVGDPLLIFDMGAYEHIP